MLCLARVSSCVRRATTASMARVSRAAVGRTLTRMVVAPRARRRAQKVCYCRGLLLDNAVYPCVSQAVLGRISDVAVFMCGNVCRQHLPDRHGRADDDQLLFIAYDVLPARLVKLQLHRRWLLRRRYAW